MIRGAPLLFGQPVQRFQAPQHRSYLQRLPGESPAEQVHGYFEPGLKHGLSRLGGGAAGGTHVRLHIRVRDPAQGRRQVVWRLPSAAKSSLKIARWLTALTGGGRGFHRGPVLLTWSSRPPASGRFRWSRRGHRHRRQCQSQPNPQKPDHADHQAKFRLKD